MVFSRLFGLVGTWQQFIAIEAAIVRCRTGYACGRADHQRSDLCGRDKVECGECPNRDASSDVLARSGKVQPAAITERIPKAKSGDSDVVRAPENSVEVVEPATKKPSLGNVRLAKPKIGRSPSVQANSATEPNLELSGDVVPAGESSLSANFADTAKQPAAPAAPVAIGGDVKPARMISSVAPMYPALAKSQHIAGSVRVDALVDTNGRVTTMKIVSGPSMLHQAAMDALRQWKYQPATLDGKPVPMHLTVTIQFRLQ